MDREAMADTVRGAIERAEASCRQADLAIQRATEILRTTRELLKT